MCCECVEVLNLTKISLRYYVFEVHQVTFNKYDAQFFAGGINFTLSYTLPVKDQKSSSGSSTPGFPSLAKSDQPATPRQPTVSPSAAPW